MTYPFPADTINAHRFHGLIQGTFELEDGVLRLRAAHGLIRLYPRPGSGGSTFHAARLQQQNHPDAVINVYGYPRTDDDGCVRRLEVGSWFVDGSPRPENNQCIARNFKPGTVYLCGRVRQVKDGLIVVKVKSAVGAKQLRWFVTGQLAGKPPVIGSKTLFAGGLMSDGLLVLRPLEMISPAGEKTRRPAAVRGRTATAPAVHPSAAGRDRNQPLPGRATPASPASEPKRQPRQPVIRQKPQPESPPDSVSRPAALQRPQR